MPKRSNNFQGLIHHIYKHTADAKVRVTESAELKERGSDAMREIDVLLEFEMAGVPIRIAVETHDHARVDDIQWIDELIGRFRDLEVDKVVAVSAAGFSGGASAKARANGIETMTLREAHNTDWPAEFRQLGLGRVLSKCTPTGVAFLTEPDWPGPVDPVRVIDSLLGETDFPTFVDRVLTQLEPELNERFWSEMPRGELTSAQLLEGLTFEASITRGGILLVPADGIPRKMLSFDLRVHVAVRLERVPIRRHLLGSVGVVSSVMALGGANVNVSLAHSPEKGLSAPLVQPLESRRRKPAPQRSPQDDPDSQ